MKEAHAENTKNPKGDNSNICERVMKKFLLGCEYGHEFEGWFADIETIHQQLKSGLLDCPYCGSTNLEKRLSAPNLSTPKTKARIKDQQQSVKPLPAAEPMSTPEADAITGMSAALAPPLGEEGAVALRMAVRALHHKIRTEFTNVGDKLAEEARKIQDGTSEDKNIYGTCTKEEQRELSEDGIDILPLPELPPEH